MHTPAQLLRSTRSMGTCQGRMGGQQGSLKRMLFGLASKSHACVRPTSSASRLSPNTSPPLTRPMSGYPPWSGKRRCAGGTPSWIGPA